MEIVPASIEAAWGLRPRSQKGPKPGLSLERVVGAAVEVADAEGLDGVSMGRVAKQLGVSTMSLYRYVGTKDELVTLMADAAFGPPRPMPEDVGWREGLTLWAGALRAAALEHPWAVLAPIAGPPTGPHMLAWLDQAIGILCDTGLSDAEQIFTAHLISNQVRADVTLAIGMAGDPRAAALAAEYSAFLLRVTADGRLPHLRRVVEGGVFDGAEQDMEMATESAYGLARVLDGIQSLIHTRTPDHP